MGKPKVLAACPPSAMPTLDRVLSPHVDLTFVNSLNAARDALRTNTDLAMVVCGVHFDESRMYELLEFAQCERPHVPFLCIRILDAELARASRERVGLALKAAGAVIWSTLLRCSSSRAGLPPSRGWKRKCFDTCVRRAPKARPSARRLQDLPCCAPTWLLCAMS